MDIPTVLSNELIGALNVLIEKGKYNEALQITNDNKYAGILKDNCWDLIPYILKQVNNDIIVTKPSLQHFCEQMLSIITDRSNPEEVLLELIEQIEMAKNDAQFLIILKPLHVILSKLTVKRGRSLEWCLNTIHSYVLSLPLPEEHNLDKEELALMDSDVNTRRIVKIYSELPQFYRSFISEVSDDTKSIHLKETLLSFLIDLLGKPLIYLDLEYDNVTKSNARVCAEDIISDIAMCGIDILKFLKYSEDKCAQNKVHRDQDGIQENVPEDIFLLPEKLSALSLGGLFYITLACGVDLPVGAVSQVYSPEYTLHAVLHLCTRLLELSNSSPVFKGLKLSKAIVERLPKNSSRALLDDRVHSSFCKSLIKVVIFLPNEQLRKDALSLLKLYVRKFDMDARSVLIEHLIKEANHSGLIGYLITMFKDFLAEGLSSESALPEPLTGIRLYRALSMFCNLPHGAESDLVELADQIIAVLNLLRFLVLRDSKNLTGIRERIPHLEKKYIEPLRDALNLSKAHYNLKLKDIDEGKKFPRDPDISLNVGGNMLDSIPLEDKRNIVLSALNAFHLIEGLIARLLECVNVNY